MPKLFIHHSRSLTRVGVTVELTPEQAERVAGNREEGMLSTWAVAPHSAWLKIAEDLCAELGTKPEDYELVEVAA